MPSNPALAVVNEPAPTRREWLGLGVLAVGLGLIVLDGTIVGVALPTIISDLALNLTDAQWVNSLYAVVLAALLLSIGSMLAVTGYTLWRLGAPPVAGRF